MFNNLGNVVPTNGLVGYRPLDGDGKDYSGNGNDGTPVNITYLKTTKGYQSQAGSFNGSSSYIRTSYKPVVTSGTLSVNIKTSNAGSSYCFICGRGGRFGLFAVNNILGIYDWGGAALRTTGINIADGKNHEIELIFTYGVTNGTFLYLDNNLVLTTTISDGTSTDGYFSIGSAYDGSTAYQYFTGIIQSVRFYPNVVLSQDERELLVKEMNRKLGPSNIASYPKLMDGLVGYWDFRGDASNLVDGVRGTVTGATLTTDRFGNSNGAYSFDGIDDYISSATGPNFGTGDRSYIIRFKTSVDQFIKALYSTRTGTNTWISIILNPGQIQFEQGNSYPTNYKSITYNTTYNDNNRHTIICETSGNNINMYYDNTLVSNTTWTPFSTDNSYEKTFGRYNGSNNFTGDIGDVMMFNRALSSDEKLVLQKLTSSDYIYPAPNYSLLNLNDGVLLKLNGSNNGTTTLYDISGNGINGTVSATPTYKRWGKAKTISLSSQSISWTSTAFTMATCFENVSGKWTLVVNPVYITTTGITSGTKEITDITLYNRSLSTKEQEQLKYSKLGNFIY